MSNLSLLVDCFKIIKWLEQRKKLNKDWFTYVKAAQSKIKILLKDHQDFSKYPELKALMHQNNQNFCFYDVNNCVDILLKTDIAQQKNLLFGYNDKRVKQWTNLKKFMQSKSVGLLNNAKFIEQSLKFDLPALDKNIQMMDNQLSNLKRKIDFNSNTIFQQENQMKKQIATVGLQISQGQNLRRLNIENIIPTIINKVPQTIKQIEEYVQNNKISQILTIYKQKVQKQGLKCQLSMLEYFIQNKNDYVDVYNGVIKRQFYPAGDKYKEFVNWKPVNEWEITIEGGNSSIIQELKLNYITLIQNRQTRQQLLYNLNQLLYFFIGLKYENADGSKKLKVQNNQMNLTENQIENTIQVLQNLINSLTLKKLLTPLELKNNKKAYQYFVSKFHNIQKNIETLQFQIKDYRKQIEELEINRNQQVQRLRKYRKKVTAVKKVQEKLLSDFVGRQVKIVGQINKLE